LDDLVIPYVGFNAQLYDLFRGHSGDFEVSSAADTVLASIFGTDGIIHLLRPKARSD
jgi:hypothetical protein